MEWQSLRDLYVYELRDLYAAQTRLGQLWRKLAETAGKTDLKQICDTHVDETDGQRQRIVTICEQLGEDPNNMQCHGIAGLEKEVETIMTVRGDPSARDAGLIAIGNRIEHYEMAAFGAARTHARLLGYEDQARTLQEALDEAAEADRKLMSLAENVNVEAV